MKFILTSAVGGLGGFLCSFIPWGREKFHGSGFPFATVYWDNGRDFPNPFAYLYNALAGCLLSLLFVLLIVALKRIFFGKPSRGNRADSR